MSSDAVDIGTPAVPYQDFVFRLCKPGEVLLSEMTVSKVHLWHMASAILGEAAEFAECAELRYNGELSKDEALENTTEELGDLSFYCVGMHKISQCSEPFTAAELDAMVLALDRDTVDTRTKIALLLQRCTALPGTDWSLTDVALEFAAVLMSAAGALFDVVKQWVIYNKEFDRIAIEVRLRALQDVCRVATECWGLTEAAVEAYNRNKLQLRYDKLVYSDQHAHDRADKK